MIFFRWVDGGYEVPCRSVRSSSCFGNDDHFRLSPWGW